MKTVLFYISTVIDTTILVSVVSTQLVLADVSSFGLVVTMGDRLSTTVRDLLGVGPALLILIGCSYLVALPVAHFLHRRIGGQRLWWFLAAGFTSLPTAIILIKLAMGGTLLASARTPLGMFLVALCSMAGAWIFVWMSDRFGSPDSKDA